jgi:hypothetical protein
MQQTDTAAVCVRNSISDITFYDPANVVTKINHASLNGFPYLFLEKSGQTEARAVAALTAHLKSGTPLAQDPLHSDWILGIILLCILLFSAIRDTTKKIGTGAARFFLFKGIKDLASRESQGLLSGYSQILNLISMFVAGLFAYYLAAYYGVIPSGVKGILTWLVCSGVVMIALILRNVVCSITGFMSGEGAVFREYLSGVYSFYRFSAIVLLVLMILISYTRFIEAKAFLMTGLVTVAVMYLFRVFKLLIIFLNRSISIFYLVLYLCALEILPVLISVKFFTGLV